MLIVDRADQFLDQVLEGDQPRQTAVFVENDCNLSALEPKLVEQFERILATFPDTDFAYYGLAVLDSITGRTQDCLKNLTRAIEMNPRNRLQARADNDFQSMVDDPRFTELLYPEIP